MVASGRVNATYTEIMDHWSIYDLTEAVDLISAMVYNEEQAHKRATQQHEKSRRR